MCRVRSRQKNSGGAYPAEGDTLAMDLSPMASEIRMASNGTTVENQEPKVDNDIGNMSPIPATRPDPEESEVPTSEDAPAQQMPPPAKVPSTDGGEPAPSSGDLLNEEASSEGCELSNLTVSTFWLSVFHFS